LTLGLYPVFASNHTKTNLKLPASVWPDLIEHHKTKSLRQLAKEYGVSYETVRRTLQVVKLQSLRRIGDRTSVMANAE